MKKALFLILILVIVCVFAVSISAKSAYLEEIPDELKNSNDTVTHFIVFDGSEYFVYEGATVQTLNTEALDSAMEELGISTSEIGTKYLTKFIIPQYMGEGESKVLVTTVNFNNGNFFKKNSTYFLNKVGYIEIPGTVTTITDIHQCTSQLRCLDFGENSQITKIPAYFLNGSGNLKKICNLPRNLTGGIGECAFANCRAFSGEVYINATSIGYKGFDNAVANATGIILGPLTKSLADQSLSCGETEAVQIEYIEFQCDITQLTIQESSDSVKGAFYFGHNSDSPRLPLKKLKCIILSNPAQKNVVDGTSFQSFFSYNVFFNSDSENPVYTSHGADDENTTVTYERLSECGFKSVPCSRCIYVETSEVEPIYSSKGYSVSSSGTGIDGGFVINKKAVEEWQRYGGSKNVKFGIVIFNPKFLSDGSILDAEGKINTEKGALQIEFVDLDYEHFGFMVSNFTEAQASLELVIAGYAVVDENYSNAEFCQKDYLLSETPAVSTVTRREVSLYTITISTVKQNQNLPSLPEYVVPTGNDEEE